MLHISSARAQGRRLFCSKANPFIVIPPAAKRVPLSFGTALNKHKNAAAANDPEKMLEALEHLRGFAEDTDYCENEYDAKDLLFTVVWPLDKDQLREHAGVVKESLEVARLLLDSASEAIRSKLCNCKEFQEELKPILERVIRDYGGSAADHEVIKKLANGILAKLPSSTLK